MKKYYVENDGIRYPKDPIMINYRDNNYLNQIRGLKLVKEENAGDQKLPPITLSDKKRRHNILNKKLI